MASILLGISDIVKRRLCYTQQAAMFVSGISYPSYHVYLLGIIRCLIINSSLSR